MSPKLATALALAALLHLAAKPGITLAGAAVRVEDILSGYKLNQQSFSSLRVTWSRAEGTSEEWIADKKWYLGYLESRSKTGASPMFLAARESIIKQLRAECNDPSALNKKVWYFDFWTDRRSFQNRVIRNQFSFSAKEPVPVHAFPDVPINDKTLVNEYKNIGIMSFTGDVKDGFRVWSGAQRKKYYLGAVLLKPEAIQFPPLAAQREPWMGASHPIDEFFALPATEMTVVKREQKDGKVLYMLAHESSSTDTATFLPPQTRKKYEGRVTANRKTVAWIDPAQGYLPIRIEYYLYSLFKEGEKVYSTLSKPGKVLEVTKIVKVANGAFYPMSGLMKTLYGSYKNTADYNVEAMLRGNYVGRGTKLVGAEMGWHVSKIEAGWEPDAAMFALSFPKDTNYYDQTKQQAFVVGEPEEQAKAVIPVGQIAEPVISAGSSVRNWLVVVNVFLVIGLVVLYLAIRRRKEKPDHAA